MKPNTNRTDKPTLLRERCLAYLLDEMTEHQAIVFESELDTPAVSEALDRESKLLCSVAASVAASESLDRGGLDRGDNDQFNQPLPCPALPRPVISQRITILVSVLAVAILAASFAAFSSRDSAESLTVRFPLTAPPASFEFELAKTWVQPAIQWASNEQPVFDDSAIDSLSTSVDEIETDESFEWMVVAVQASIPKGERTDG